ncbi:DUF3263 domain-containing protein [Streptomyces sp. 8L]|uniref:DUF3263 domain-containing protein n=1 Tax=Streptomyces sp. 8L TaxID=2877242 RepID=UPI001CD7FDD6|nr:DUF3263 domain-containing protein [Streptomyces sp. 8L]MCA1219369.1 DUF3263 domain-containing protein [Streptomyces sp. 8L]
MPTDAPRPPEPTVPAEPTSPAEPPEPTAPAEPSASPPGPAGDGGAPGDGTRAGEGRAAGEGTRAGDGSAVEDGARADGSGLSGRDRAVLALERLSWSGPGAKERAIRERLGMSPTRYYQVLNALIDDRAATAYDPVTLNRLRRVRQSRRDTR